MNQAGGDDAMPRRNVGRFRERPDERELDLRQLGGNGSVRKRGRERWAKAQWPARSPAREAEVSVVPATSSSEARAPVAPIRVRADR